MPATFLGWQAAVFAASFMIPSETHSEQLCCYGKSATYVLFPNLFCTVCSNTPSLTQSDTSWGRSYMCSSRELA